MSNADVMVIGIGGMGSAAAYELARRGLNVVGIEQFDIAHDRGSAHGGTRLIRKAYFEHPDYVPLLKRTESLWLEAEAAGGESLLRRTGLLLCGAGEGAVIGGVREAAMAHRLSLDELPAGEVPRRYPGLAPADGTVALFERDAGVLWVERCIRTMIGLAERAGARFRFQERVTGWEIDGPGIRVRTDRGDYSADRLVICGGSWSARLLAELGLPLSVRRTVVRWYETPARGFRLDEGWPVFAFDTPEGFFYGFPAWDGEPCVKIGDHTGGERLDDVDRMDRVVHPADTVRIRRFVADRLPGLREQVVREGICPYTMTPDEHFIIDRHPQHESVVFAAGFSGHGFKFAPLIGSVLADLAIDGTTPEPVEFLRAGRFERAG